jgi:hypothetical protein
LPLIEGVSDGRQIILSIAVLGSDNPTDLTFINASALLDTGATVSGIGPRIISELGLESHGKRPLGSATEIRMVNYFMFRLGIFSQPEQPLPYIFRELEGFGWPEPKSFDVILGMDVLKQCDFSMDRKGSWSLAFG